MAEIKTVLTDERAEFIKWITYTYPKTYTVEDADHYWRMEHVSALAWKARAVLEAAPASSAMAMQAVDAQHAKLYRYLIENCLIEDSSGWLELHFETNRQGKDHPKSCRLENLTNDIEEAMQSQQSPVQAIASKDVQDEQLHTFINRAAADGYVFDGVDAADLYVRLFPQRYEDACKFPTQQASNAGRQG